MSEPYIAEIQTSKWTSKAIRDEFLKTGFELRDWPLTTHLEKKLPADFAFYSPNLSKLFGLQYKALYRNGEDFWPLNPDQHKSLRHHQWIYYCCSELKDVTEHGLALDFARFYKPRFPFQASISHKEFFKGGDVYSRWKGFYRGIKECRFGTRVESLDQLRNLLPNNVGAARARETNQMMEYFLTDFDKRVVPADRQF